MRTNAGNSILADLSYTRGVSGAELCSSVGTEAPVNKIALETVFSSRKRTFGEVVVFQPLTQCLQVPPVAIPEEPPLERRVLRWLYAGSRSGLWRQGMLAVSSFPHWRRRI